MLPSLPIINEWCHIQDFGDTPASSYGDIASPVADATPTPGKCTSDTRNATSLTEDAGASPKPWMCDTAVIY